MELSSNLDVVSAILQICLIDLLLSGDNAIVIAMACAGLPADLRSRAVLLGTGAAVFFRVIFAFVATLMLRAPYLKLIGAGLLLLIAIELLAGDSDGRAAAQRNADSGIWRAIVLIVVADAVMSLDNVVAVAAAAQDNLLYLLLGLAISVPILVFSSLFLARLLGSYPVIVEAGAALLGWIAGKIAVSDPAIAGSLATQSFGLVAAAPVLGALYVWIQGRRLRAERAAAPRQPAAATAPAPATVAASVPAVASIPAVVPVPAVASMPAVASVPAVASKPAVASIPAAAPAAVAPAPRAARLAASAVVTQAPAPQAAKLPPAATAPPAVPTLAPPTALPPFAGADTGAEAVAAAGAGTEARGSSTAGAAHGLTQGLTQGLKLPRRLTKMDLTILGGVAVPLLGFVAMIVYFIVHAAIPR